MSWGGSSLGGVSLCGASLGGISLSGAGLGGVDLCFYNSGGSLSLSFFLSGSSFNNLSLFNDRGSFSSGSLSFGLFFVRLSSLGGRISLSRGGLRGVSLSWGCSSGRFSLSLNDSFDFSFLNYGSLFFNSSGGSLSLGFFFVRLSSLGGRISLC